jgi:hypothetical protein
MITTSNYYSITKNIDFNSFPEALRKGHDFVNRTTQNGADWSAYTSSSTIHQVMDTYFVKLDEQLNRTAPLTIPITTSNTTAIQQTVAPRSTIQKIVKRNQTAKKQVSENSIPPSNNEVSSALVERIPDELKMMKRYILMHGKTKTKDELLRFINSLQKAIIEKRIRKTSPYADDIKYMQHKLITTYNEMNAKVLVKISDDIIKKFKEKLDGEKIYPSVQFIKKYLRLNGKKNIKSDIKKLVAQLSKAVKNGKLMEDDKYSKALQVMYKNLKGKLVEKGNTELQIEPSELNGLNELLGHCGCSALHGVDDEFAKSEATIMNSMDFANMHFKTIGLKGKWFDLIGDPSTNFTAMVFGKPKMGKSYLCVDFAGYLARHHGKVLYVAKEEGLDLTLQQKLNDKNVKHPNLFVANELPTSLSNFDFIILDSVNKLGLQPEDLTRLKKANPTKSFVFVFQSTKEGNFRGANSFQHDVDVVIEIPERGKAIQFGRFNQGGEINIFSDENVAFQGFNGLGNIKNNSAITIKQEIQSSISKLNKLIDKWARNRKPTWSVVVDLANLHSSLGQELNSGYKSHFGNSTSVKDGIIRHKEAIKLLLKKLNNKANEMYAKGQMESLHYWNNFLKELQNGYR